MLTGEPGGRCTRGGEAGWVPGRVYRVLHPAGQIEAYLWNIKLESVDTAV